jgi:hypothetical protein
MLYNILHIAVTLLIRPSIMCPFRIHLVTVPQYMVFAVLLNKKQQFLILYNVNQYSCLFCSFHQDLRIL